MRIKLLHGDCLEQHKTIGCETVDLILADLPYGTTNVAWDKTIDLSAFFDDVEYMLKPTGCVVLFGIMPFTADLVNAKRDWFKYSLVWDKNKCGSPGLAKVRPMRTHEDILVFAPGKTTYNPQMETGEPYKRRQSGKTRCNTHSYGFTNDQDIVNEGTRYPKSIVRISRDFSAQQQIHATQKPVPLMEWLIKTYSNPGDLVLDSTMGSGSTGVAAINTQRDFIGIEKEHDIFQLAFDRINTALINEVI